MRQFAVTPCGTLFRAKISSTIGGECSIEKKIEWLHITTENPKEEKKNFINPNEEEGKVIEEYFGIELKKEDKKVTEEKKINNEIVLSLTSNSNLSDSIQDPIAKTDKEKTKEKEVTDEWLIVD